MMLLTDVLAVLGVLVIVGVVRRYQKFKTMPLMTPVTWHIFVGVVVGAFGILLLGYDR